MKPLLTQALSPKKGEVTRKIIRKKYHIFEDKFLFSFENVMFRVPHLASIVSEPVHELGILRRTEKNSDLHYINKTQNYLTVLTFLILFGL